MRLLLIAGLLLHSALADVCLMPKDPGPCRALALKFYFNKDTKRCEILRYGGCRGNGNNFNSLKECHSACQDHLDDPSAGFAVHLKSSQCMLPAEEGEMACMAAIPKWTFNPITARCERYTYGGCHGTRNLYNSQRECMNTCVHDGEAAAPRAPVATFRGARVGAAVDDTRIVFPDSDICNLPPIQPGPIACTAFKPRWTYDGRQGKCVEYIYGGCRGTKNLFETESACQAACPGNVEGRSNEGWTRPEFCNGPQVEGPIACAASVPKWTFNKETLQCERYIYGGCHATANVFDSESDCLTACDRNSLEPPRTLEVCSMPIDQGPCRGQKPKIGFNPETQRCERFFYGGCKGNANRFNSVEDCVNTCGGLSEPEDNPLCALIKCDRRVANVNRAKGCVPVTKPGECCPSEWDCTAWEERLQRKEQCFLVSNKYPRGKYYSEDDPVPEAEDKCKPDCRCGPDGQIICMDIMCDWVPLGPQPDPSCVRVTGSPDSCCSLDKWVCGEEAAALATCEIEGKVFYENQYIGDNHVPGDDPCKFCHCKAGWDGSFSDEFCTTIQHPLGLSDDKLQRGCVPVFMDGVCGATDWVCPAAERPSMCHVVECDWKEMHLNTAKGCLPSYKEGECCPSDWDCSAWEERLQRTDQCFYASEENPQGKFYNVGEDVPEAESKCARACSCGPDGNIMCAHVDCFEPETLKVEGETCEWIHKRPDDCCSGGGWVCGEELEALATCNINGKVYYEGQYIEDDDNPHANPCTSCICRAGWDNSYSDKFCTTFKNPLGLSDSRLQRGCIPVIQDNVCGAIDWNCPAIQPPQIPDGPPLPPVARPPPPVGAGIACPPGIDVDFANLPTTVLSPEIEPLDTSPASGDGQVSAVTLPERLPRTVKPDVCLLPKAQGPCKGFKDMWYFDNTERVCKMYKYGGFTMFGNVFVDEEQCKTTCFKYLLDGATECEAISENNAPGRSDRCLPFQKKFRFNAETGRCEDFTSRGCRENFNSYRTIEECEAKCVKETVQSRVIGKEPHCNERVVKGNCRSQLRRFYFDEESGKCKLFLYSGCQGNANNFLTERECTKTCVPDQLAARSSVPQTLEIRDPCTQTKEVGRCLAMKPRYFYDEVSRTCRIFFYGGCGGNANNFKTLRACADTCDVDPVQQRRLRDVCREPKKVGPCRAMAKKWFFNGESGKCEQFVFGGCRPNGNNFDSREDCLATCEFVLRDGGVRKSPFITVGAASTLPIAISPAKKEATRRGPFIEVGGATTLPIAINREEDVGTARIIEVGLAATLPERIDPLDDPCMLDKVVGRCKAAMPRFYFDRETKKCQRFIYGGCGGNGNNFGTLEACLGRCAPAAPRARLGPGPPLPENPICFLPVDMGPCRGQQRKFYFDPTTSRCERFVYGGCKGNENRFDSLRDCISACGKHPRGGLLSPRQARIPPPPTKVCTFGDKMYNLGDVVKSNEDKCRTCYCATPPTLICTEKSCATPEQPEGKTDCQPVMDEDGCCQTGWVCADDEPEDVRAVLCQHVPCPLIGFLEPPNSVCTPEYDEQGCCQVGMSCVPRD